MTSAAILIGNASYDHEDALPCCCEDVAAMQLLLTATGRFTNVHVHTDLDADSMRDAVRSKLPPGETYDEVVFYYSGHGAQVGPDLFLCGTNYDGRRPNETGLRHGELLDLFRATNPDLLVMIFDTCFSGTRLIKRSAPLFEFEKSGLHNIIQFSSSLDNQTSLSGERLSAYTRSFIDATLRKSDGKIYYTDIQNFLRDEFANNESQTPYFVNQGTGREIFSDDAHKLADFRKEFFQRWHSESSGGDPSVQNDRIGITPPAPEPPTPKQLLEAAEKRMACQDDVEKFVGNLFDELLKEFNESEFAEFFEITNMVHSTFREPVIREFMIRVLSKEVRPDRLVTAEIIRTPKDSPATQFAFDVFSHLQKKYTEDYILDLNCTMSKAQLKLTFTPKYTALQQMKLVISCAPSLINCYVFEMLTQHPRVDWNEFSEHGSEIVRRWYQMEWNSDCRPLIKKICGALNQAVRDHIEETAKRLQ